MSEPRYLDGDPIALGETEEEVFEDDPDLLHDQLNISILVLIKVFQTVWASTMVCFGVLGKK